ncbi:MAG: D-alanyl-D-alanine carboxypeptidase [Pseudonocardiales bacterium]|nr:D-alanyl-D-alanine carboxypeptidase [Pseudonocardiales bacterium]
MLILAAAAGTGGYLVTDHVRADHAATVARTAPPTPSALASATAAPAIASAAPDGQAPRAAAVAAALAQAVAGPALGGRLLAQVVDATSGVALYNHLGPTPAAPASTGKLLTAAALLAVRAPTDRLTTNVVAGAAGTVVLVGGGDPTLTGAPTGQPGAYAGAARISDLATQVRRALAASHQTVQRIVVDNSLFAGPTVSPDWAAEDVPSDYAGAITAVMADGGRAAPTDGIRSAEPDLAAGAELAAALKVPGAQVTRGKAPAAAKVLGTVKSATLSDLVGQMLQASDNVIAEVLARQVAVATAKPASFTGAAAAIRAALVKLGVDPGAGMRDGSGLAADDRVSAAALAGVLRLVVGAKNPALHAIVTGLPVAAWSGTLANRYLPGSTGARGAGVVRAKTGTLTAVSSLAGIVHDADGRLITFAFIADRVPPGVEATRAAEAALDRVAAILAGCGCR